MRILDITFNRAVLRMVSVHLPNGFDITEVQTETIEQFRNEFVRTGRVSVNTGFSDRTIFGHPSVNWSFRAWHDYCHLLGGFGFDKTGERNASLLQTEQLETEFAGHPRLEYWKKILDIEVNGQLEYLERTGSFPTDQYEFTLSELKTRSL